jgi:hypothetical protein
VRNISFMLTQPQVLNQTKTVTRRNGWKNQKVGELLQGVEKGQGLKKGEKIKKLVVVRVTSVRTEPLRRMIDDRQYGREECRREGFPDMSPEDFCDMFMKSHSGVRLDTEITRIGFDYPTQAEIAQFVNPISEADFQKQVIDLAHVRGWRVAHFRPARVTVKGKETYRTAMAGDIGFPDLVLARRGCVLHVELKREDGKLSADQEKWSQAIGATSYLWRPSDWKHIEAILTHSRRP